MRSRTGDAGRLRYVMPAYDRASLFLERPAAAPRALSSSFLGVRASDFVDFTAVAASPVPAADGLGPVDCAAQAHFIAQPPPRVVKASAVYDECERPSGIIGEDDGCALARMHSQGMKSMGPRAKSTGFVGKASIRASRPICNGVSVENGATPHGDPAFLISDTTHADLVERTVQTAEHVKNHEGNWNNTDLSVLQLSDMSSPRRSSASSKRSSGVGSGREARASRTNSVKEGRRSRNVSQRLSLPVLDNKMGFLSPVSSPENHRKPDRARISPKATDKSPSRSSPKSSLCESTDSIRGDESGSLSAAQGEKHSRKHGRPRSLHTVKGSRQSKSKKDKKDDLSAHQSRVEAETIVSEEYAKKLIQEHRQQLSSTDGRKAVIAEDRKAISVEERRRRILKLNDIDDWSDAVSTVGTESIAEQPSVPAPVASEGAGVCEDPESLNDADSWSSEDSDSLRDGDSAASTGSNESQPASDPPIVFERATEYPANGGSPSMSHELDESVAELNMGHESDTSTVADFKYQDADEGADQPASPGSTTLEDRVVGRQAGLLLSPGRRRLQRGSSGDSVSCLAMRHATMSGGDEDPGLHASTFGRYLMSRPSQRLSDESSGSGSGSSSTTVPYSDDAYDTFCRVGTERPRRNSYISRLVTGHVSERPPSTSSSAATVG